MSAVSDEPMCPGCKSVAQVRVLNFGWLFRCEACDWEYGHPQFMDRQDAREALFDARRCSNEELH